MKFTSLSDSLLDSQTRSAAEREKSATLELLEYLAEVDRRRLYSARGYSSLFEYVHKALGYSEAQSSERVSAMRLIRRVPEVGEALKCEKLTLTSVAKLASHVRREKSAPTETLSLLGKCEGKSTREVEKVLVENARAETPRPDRVRPISKRLTRLTLEVDEEFMNLLEEVKKGCASSNMQMSDLLKRAMKEYVRKGSRIHRHKKAQSTSSVQRNASRAPEVKRVNSVQVEQKRYIPIQIRRQVFTRAGNRCEFVDETTGRRCEGECSLEIDHIQPFSRGGKHEMENLRVLCKSHNLFHAIQKYGETKMKPYLRN